MEQSLHNSPHLTLDLQRLAQKKYVWFIRINTISFGCLAESVLILYAIKNGADDFLVGLMTSFLYLTMPLMFFGKKLVGKFGAAKTYSISWLSRNLSAVLMVFVPAAIHHFNQKIGLVLLIISTFGFFAFRSVGFTANTPLIGEITSKSNRGNYLSKIWLNFTAFFFLTLLLLMFILRHSETVETFQGIIIFGVFMGVVSSLLVYRIPESESTKISAQKSIASSFNYLRSNSLPRKLLYAWTASTSALMLVVPFSMVALKNGYFLADHHALFFALIQLAGGIIASLFNILILDRVGPRPMLILYCFGLILNSVLWVFSPVSFLSFYTALVFLINGMCLAGINTTLSHYFLSSVPDEERVGANMFIYMISGVAAGLTGTFLGGGLLKLLRFFEFENLVVYRTYFFIVLIVLVPVIYFVQRVERLEDWRIKDVFGIFTSMRDLRALVTLNKLEKDLSFQQDYSGVKKLRELPSDLSEEKLLQYLESPHFSIRAKALGALGHIKFGNKTEKAIIEQIEVGEFTSAYIAADIVGEHRISHAIPLLRKYLDSADIYLQGKCMLSLAQLKDATSYDKIKDIFMKSKNPRIILHGAQALLEINELKNVLLILNKVVDIEFPVQIRDELLYDISEMCGTGDTFYKFLKMYKSDPFGAQAFIRSLIHQFNKEVADECFELEKEISKLKLNQSYSGDQFSRFMRKKAKLCRSEICDVLLGFLNNVGNRPIFIELAFCLLIIIIVNMSRK